MTANVDIVNRALQTFGTRTTVTAGELVANSTNEAIQANLVLTPSRRQLLRMAPWSCGLKTINLVYVSSVPGTPENVSPVTPLWQPGQPSPPWAYEYQYPVDCLRACWLIAASQTGFAGGVPITTAVTGGAAGFWRGPPVKFKVQTDTFVPVTGAAVASPGLGYAVGDQITLAAGVNTNPPIGAPAILQVATIGGSGAIATVSVVSQMPGAVLLGGSYFAKQPNPVAQGSTTGAGVGATFTLTYGPAAPQRVVLTNQEFATMVHVVDIGDPNLMDDQFQEAWAQVLGAQLCLALTGDKKIANGLIMSANRMIEMARTTDGNEGLTVNDVTPDWLRIRGIDFESPYSGPFSGFDWGSMFPVF